jgi:hypothetical protein
MARRRKIDVDECRDREADVCPCSSPTVTFNLEMAFLGFSPIVEGVGKAGSPAKVYFLYVPREPRPA